jgi:hypothetical protein
MISKAHATEPNYELHTLGWLAFQNLCATILSEVLGQTFEQFLPTKDGGRDGAFMGQWGNLAEGGVKGSFAVQCKHTSVSGKTLSIAILSDEIEKARSLARKGFATNYLLLTNFAITGTNEEEIRKAFEQIEGIRYFGLFGNTWINSKIREYPRLRMIVPRVYGLGDLSLLIQILFQILRSKMFYQIENMIR